MAYDQTRAVDRRSVATRAALIEAAERLFAQRGTEGVSLRDVSAAAGQRNHTAAQYHFGDRLGLIAAVFDNRMVGVYSRRERMLREAGGPLGLEDALRVVVAPVCEVVMEARSWYARFLLRCKTDAFAWETVESLDSTRNPLTFERSFDSVLQAAPALAAPVREHRFDQLVTMLIAALARWEELDQEGRAPMSLPDLSTELVTTMAAVIQAPATR